MGRKSAKIEALIEKCRGRELDPHYLGFFECFNAGLYFEAHDVLEPLWLARRGGENHSFYKGLIQLAGAFVHLQKNRLRPAAALFKLAEDNLKKYPAQHSDLDVHEVLVLISTWKERLEVAGFQANPLGSSVAPRLVLKDGQRDVTAGLLEN